MPKASVCAAVTSSVSPSPVIARAGKGSGSAAPIRGPVKIPKRFRIAQERGTGAYSIQFSSDGKHWEDGLRGLDLRKAQGQLARLKQFGCQVSERIVVM